ncbi:MAG: ribosomal protein S18-alanine N-acetyltransferase [Bacillota bacterium]
MEPISIRKMGLDDLDRVMEIEHKSYTLPWSYTSYVYELVENSRALYIVAQLGTEVVGYCGMWIIFDEGHITTIAVDPAHRRKGIGRRLIEALMEMGATQGVKRFTLEVRVSNLNAQSLYKAMGFQSVGIRKGYYSDNGEDAYIMWCEPADEVSSLS